MNEERPITKNVVEFYENIFKTVKTVMVNNSTNINKRQSPLILTDLTEHKNRLRHMTWFFLVVD
jgi:hypothetical protein